MVSQAVRHTREMTIHERLVKLRHAANLTQEELAELLGVTQMCISSWETGRSAPKRTRMREVAKALKVSEAELAGVK